MAACPYGARSFNWRDPRPFIGKLNPDFPTRTKGVVEKCNFCEERLAKGHAPGLRRWPARRRRWSSAIWTIRTRRSGSFCDRTFTIRRKPELGTEPQVYYMV